MAISTGDIDATAMSALQTNVEAGKEVRLNLSQLCYIFKKKYELDGADIRTDFLDMANYLEAQAWATGTVRFFVEHHMQNVVFSEPLVPEPST